MRKSPGCAVLFVVVLCLAIGGSECDAPGDATYMDMFKRITSFTGNIRANLRSIRKLAAQHGLLAADEDALGKDAIGSGEEPPSAELEVSSAEVESSEKSGQDFVANTEGRKKGGGGGSNNNIVVAGGGGGGHDDGSYSISIEDGGNKKGKKGKKGKKRRKQKKKKGWKKHMKKAVPIGLGVLALKALLLHFILKKLVMATALSLFLSKKSLLVSSLIALKLMLTQPHSSDKSESSKLEVVHIPIRKETGFHKKFQQQKVLPSKPKLQPLSTKAPLTFSQFDTGPHQIQHTHQQMADFGGKYIPLGYDSGHFQFGGSTPSYLDTLPQQSVENFFNDPDELQFERRDGWDGWSGWNRGEEENRFPSPQSYNFPDTQAENNYLASYYSTPDYLNQSRYGQFESTLGSIPLKSRRKRKF